MIRPLRDATITTIVWNTLFWNVSLYFKKNNFVSTSCSHGVIGRRKWHCMCNIMRSCVAIPAVACDANAIWRCSHPYVQSGMSGATNHHFVVQQISPKPLIMYVSWTGIYVICKIIVHAYGQGWLVNTSNVSQKTAEELTEIFCCETPNPGFQIPSRGRKTHTFTLNLPLIPPAEALFERSSTNIFRGPLELGYW